MPKHILIMEDDFDIQEVIAEFLKAKDYAVTAVPDGLEGIRRFNREPFDLVIVDVMMPKISGYEVARTIRSKSDIPIIMLTALGDETDQIRGFEAGIDDYVTKPFSFELLIKRVEAVLRRSRVHSPERNQYALNELRIDCDAYRAYVHEREVALTTREFEIVRTLLANRGKVVTRERMLESVWGYDFFGDTRLIDTHIKNIRKKLNVPYIKTIKGVGYKSMNKPWLHAWRRSITFKIFLITLALLIISATLIYAVLYLYLPSQYEKNKINLLEEKIAPFTRSIEGIPLEEAVKLIDELARQTNSVVLLTDRDEAVYISSMLSATGSGTSRGILRPLDPESNVRVERGFVSTGPPVAKVEPAGQPVNPFNRQIPVTVDGRPMTLVVNTMLQPVDEAARVMALFIPNIALITLAVSLAGAYMFSRIVARPLIRLNQAAPKMAGLKFPAAIRYTSQDEIGQLAGSLNEMSANLRQALDDLHQTNEQLKIEMAKEREIEDQRRRLFAMISHELKSPLTAVKGQLEGMIHGLGAYRDRDKYLKRSKAILDGMEQLIHDILQISKLEQHTFEPALERVNLSNIIQDAIGRAAFFAEQKRIHLKSDIMPNAQITADPQLLEKAVYNIIHNGITHSDPGERVVIGLTEDRDSNACILTVLNTGTRIPDHKLHKVFDPFYRPEESRSRNNGGSGLGLYLVRSVFDALSVEYALRNVPEGVQFRAVFKTDLATENSPELHTGSI